MKRAKYFISMLICVAIIFTFSVPVMAAELGISVSEINAIDANGNGEPSLEDQVAALQAQLEALMASLEELTEIPEVDYLIIQRQLSEAATIERH
ncbi:MAG: hypothetical protein FWC96_10375, partial [Oscillospiraceae bacterium]|nr:hypothetical protein [Oscillospiraceae bacterium]